VDEYQLMRRILGLGPLSSPDVWLAVAYLVCLFAVLIFRPQQISSPYLFRISYILFAVSYIVPTFVDAIVQMTMFDELNGMRSGRGGIALMIVSPFFRMIGRVLFGVSVLCGFTSLRPRGEDGVPRPSRPTHVPPADE